MARKGLTRQRVGGEFTWQVTIWMRPQVGRALKILAAATDTTIQSLVDRVVSEALSIPPPAPPVHASPAAPARSRPRAQRQP